MIVDKAPLVKILKFAALASDYATLTVEHLGSYRIVATAIHYDRTYFHRAKTLVSTTEDPSDFKAQINIPDVLKALKILHSPVTIDLEDAKLVLADDFLTFRLVTYDYGEDPKLFQPQEDGVMRFHPVDFSELSMFLRLASKVSDFTKVKITEPAEMYSGFAGDEVRLRVQDYTGEASATYNSNILAQLAQFVKGANNAFFHVQDDGPLRVEIEYMDSTHLEAQLVNVEAGE